jgi:hypothetical protein
VSVRRKRERVTAPGSASRHGGLRRFHCRPEPNRRRAGRLRVSAFLGSPEIEYPLRSGAGAFAVASIAEFTYKLPPALLSVRRQMERSAKLRRLGTMGCS